MENEISHSAQFSLMSTLSDATQLREWTVTGLPVDDFSIENAIIMRTANRFPLLIDPQGINTQASVPFIATISFHFPQMSERATEWLKRIEQPNALKVVKLTDLNYMQTIKKAISDGCPVLIENIEENIGVALQSLLDRNIVRAKSAGSSESAHIHIDGHAIVYSERFRLYLTTVCTNPNFMPEIVSKVTLLNFVMNEPGLQREMLSTIIGEERIDLQERKEKLIGEQTKNRDLLYKLESNIFDVLSASEGNILEDENAINILSTSKAMSEEIQAKQVANATIELDIDTECCRNLPLAEYATILYFCVTRLATVNAMYQFTLQWFRRHFVRNLRETAASQSTDERIVNLEKSFTHHLYDAVCPTLFARDRLVFSLMICIDVMRLRCSIDAEQIAFLFATHTEDETNESAEIPDSVSWMDPNSWHLLTRASQSTK